MGNFLTDLRRRKVFQVAAIYAVTAWLLAQAASLAETSLQLPIWFDAAIIVTLALGFPIAVILAYAFEVTPDGLRRTGAPEEKSEALQRGIAVLPFLNISDNRDHEFLADGMTEDLITKLAFRLDMMVIARNSTFHYKGTSPDVREVGRELNVLYVLEGSIRHMGDNTRITAQLIETEKGGHIWSEMYDRPTAEIFDVQDDVVDSIAQALRSSVRMSETERAIAKPVDDLEVWELLARARSFRSITPSSLLESENVLDKALGIDPENVQARVMKYMFAGMRYAIFDDSVPPAELKAEVLQEIESVAGRVGRDPQLMCETGHALALIGEYQATIDLLDTDDPHLKHFTEYYMALGYALAWTGRTERAVELMEEGLRRDPVGVTGIRWHRLAVAYSSNRQFTKAIGAARNAIRQQPDYIWSWIELSQWLIREGDVPGAVKAIVGARKVNPNLCPETLSDMYDRLGTSQPTKEALLRRFQQAWDAAELQ